MHAYFVETPTRRSIKHSCRRCHVEFVSNNKLYQHLRSCRTSVVESTAIVYVNHATIISSNTVLNRRSNINFRFFKYIIFLASIDELSSLHELCDDIDCDASLIDRTFVAQEISDFESKLQHSEVSIKIRDIDDVTLSTN